MVRFLAASVRCTMYWSVHQYQMPTTGDAIRIPSHGKPGSDNGRPLTNSPAHVVTGGMTWTPQLSDYVAGLLHIDFRMQGDSTPLNEPIARPFVANDGHEIVNARVGLTFNDRYSIEGYVENLFNTYYNITAFPIPELGASFAVYPSAPRFYGLRVRASF